MVNLGPGFYESGNFKNSTKSIAISKDKRSKETKSGVPGPGYYDLKTTLHNIPKYLLNNLK